MGFKERKAEMPNDSKDLLTLIVQGIPAMGLALFGSFAELMVSSKKIDVKFILGSFVAGAFVGLMVYLLLIDVEAIPEPAKGAIIGGSGASARAVMQLIKDKSEKIISKTLK